MRNWNLEPLLEKNSLGNVLVFKIATRSNRTTTDGKGPIASRNRNCVRNWNLQQMPGKKLARVTPLLAQLQQEVTSLQQTVAEQRAQESKLREQLEGETAGELAG